MKQYTTPEQTAKLIKFGLPKPRYYSTDKYTIIHTGFDIINYSIGELIEMLEFRSVSINVQGFEWSVDTYYYGIEKYELIDALFAMVVKCKEEGEI